MIEIKVVTNPVSVEQISQIAADQFGDMVKFVVDIQKEIMAIGGDLHADEEATLIEAGSEQKNLWGINYYLDKSPEDTIEFDSMINLRPSQNNRSRDVEDPETRTKVVAIVNRLVV